MILIVDMTNKTIPLLTDEFINPILHHISMPYRIHHYTQSPPDITDITHIIISGTALKDDTYLNHLEQLQWICQQEKPTLGICAGMQVIALLHGATKISLKQIGMIPIHSDHPLFDGITQGYALHHWSCTTPKTFDTLARSSESTQCISHNNLLGILFHPEVQTPIIQRFITQAHNFP